jgi:hypothetical protein
VNQKALTESTRLSEDSMTRFTKEERELMSKIAKRGGNKLKKQRGKAYYSRIGKLGGRGKKKGK